jgi:hypothetical protein
MGGRRGKRYLRPATSGRGLLKRDRGRAWKTWDMGHTGLHVVQRLAAAAGTHGGGMALIRRMRMARIVSIRVRPISGGVVGRRALRRQRARSRGSRRRAFEWKSMSLFSPSGMGPILDELTRGRRNRRRTGHVLRGRVHAACHTLALRTSCSEWGLTGESTAVSL